MSQSDCVFCKIAAGQIPSLQIFEDGTCLAFLDIGPLTDGHLLLIPRNHYEQITDMPEADVAALAGHLPRLVKAVVRATGAAGCNVLQNNGKVSGQFVPHVHFHLIPRREGDGLGYRWNAGKYAEGKGQQMQKSLQDALR